MKTRMMMNKICPHRFFGIDSSPHLYDDISPLLRLLTGRRLWRTRMWMRSLRRTLRASRILDSTSFTIYDMKLRIYIMHIKYPSMLFMSSRRDCFGGEAGLAFFSFRYTPNNVNVCLSFGSLLRCWKRSAVSGFARYSLVIPASS